MRERTDFEALRVRSMEDASESNDGVRNVQEVRPVHAEARLECAEREQLVTLRVS